MLFDTHVHLNAKQFEDDREKTIQRAYDAGVKNMVVVGFDRETIPLAIEIAESYPAIYAAVGWHPVDAIDMTEEDLKWIEQLSFHPKVVAIGEMGLDYHWDKSPRDIQKEVFRKQIALAKKVNMPIIIHNREATEDIIKILQEENAKEIGGIMHCYNDSVKYVQDCLDMNFYISLGGPVTFKNAPLPKEVAKEVPLDRLLIETDDRPEVKIDWRIYTKDPNNPLIRDLIIEGLSLARTQKEEFSSILSSNNGNIDVLFKTLEEFSNN